MGNDPASSVTDRSGRVHSVPNVYVADGSLLVNPGGSNPSLTIQALAYWVSAAIVREQTGQGALRQKSSIRNCTSAFRQAASNSARTHST